MDVPGKNRKAELSMAAGLVIGGVAGFLLGRALLGEAGAGLVIGAGLGLVIAAFYCGLAKQQ